MQMKKNCPFCGYSSRKILGPDSKPYPSTHGKGYQVECINCGARGPCGMATANDAVGAWDHGEVDPTQRNSIAVSNGN